MKRLSHLVIALCAVVALLITSAPPVAAAEAKDPSGSISLVSQTDWNTGTNPFDLLLRVQTDLTPDDAEVVVTVFNQVRNRSQYQQSLADRIGGSSIILERHALSEVLGPDGNVTVSLPIQDSTQKRYFLKESGIYPVRVELRNTDTSAVISHFVTHVINEPAAQSPTQTLGVATVLPLQAAQSTDNSNPLATPDSGQAFSTVGATLLAHPKVPSEIIAEPESLERLAKANTATTTSAINDFKTGLAGRPVARTTWAPLPASMYSSELNGELARQVARGGSVLDSNFTNFDRNTWFATDQVDANVLNGVQASGYSQIVLPETSVALGSRSMTLERPITVSAGKNKPSMAAGIADLGLSDHFADPAGPILGAHRLLADLAVLWNDSPSTQRAVIVMPPRNWNPDPGFLETMFRGLDTSPVLTSQSVDQFFATPPEKAGGAPLSRPLNALTKSQTSVLSPSSVLDTRKLVDGFSNLVNPDNETLASLEQRMLLAERSELDQRPRESTLSGIKSSINKELELVQLPSERSIRLTARQGQIPISVQNDTGYEVHVLIELTSNKLTFPQGSSRMVDLSRQHVTEGFVVDARTSGAFPLQVRLVSPDGGTTLERSAVTIHSTATSNIGIGLSIGAGAFLIIWWIRSAFKTRHRKRHATTTEPTAA